MSATAGIVLLVTILAFTYVMNQIEHRVKLLREDHDDLIKTIDDLRARVYELEDAEAKRRRASGCGL